MKVSLLISTYNSPEALEACLKGVLNQTMPPHEVLIADDGSTTPRTREVIEAFREKVDYPVVHAWQPNEGFRAGTIRNKAIARSTGDYIVQIDGDILIEPHFIADHMCYARPGRFACGSRVILNQKLTPKVYANPAMRIGPLTKGIANRKNAIRSSFLAAFFNRLPSESLKYRGCNMAFWRSDFMAVNGYDDTYNGWGCEDHDLVARLMNNGVRPLQIRHMAVCYHMWHPSSKKSDTFARNNELLEQTRREHRTWCEKGVNQYLDNPTVPQE